MEKLINMSFEMMNVPWIEQRKIQAQVLVPIVKAFQAELGEERANQIVASVLDDRARNLGQGFSALVGGSPIEKIVAGLPIMAAGDALDVEMIESTSDALDVNVTRCRHAEFYKELGEPDLGFLLVCRGDFAMAEGVSPDLELTRTQTIMQGASHCDFRYRLKGKESQR